MISFFPILVGLEHKPLSGADTVGSLPKLNLKLKYIIINIIGDYKGSLVLWELIFAITTDWFFLLGINFCDFRKYPVPSTDNIVVFIEYEQ